MVFLNVFVGLLINHSRWTVMGDAVTQRWPHRKIFIFTNLQWIHIFTSLYIVRTITEYKCYIIFTELNHVSDLVLKLLSLSLGSNRDTSLTEKENNQVKK